MLSAVLIRACLAVSFCTMFLTACNPAQTPISLSVEKPEIIQFGSSIANIQSALTGMCSTLKTRAIDPPSIPNVASQTQIDCQGFDYFGSKRKAEFIFLNDALHLTWILVEEDEITALETAFSNQFGAPTFAKDTILSYANNFAAVRSDTPEALYYSEAAAPFVIDRIHKLPNRD